MSQSNVSKPALITGWVLTLIPVGMLLLSAAMKFAHPPPVLEGFKKFGFSESTIVPLGVTELVATLLFLFPRTAVLGAILVTGYLGGAIATHVHGGGEFFTAAVLGVMAWGGLFFRDPRLRVLLPLRR